MIEKEYVIQFVNTYFVHIIISLGILFLLISYLLAKEIIVEKEEEHA